MLADYKIRIVANACITRYDRGEKDMIAVVNSYNLDQEDKDLVLARIFSLRNDIEATVQ